MTSTPISSCLSSGPTFESLNFSIISTAQESESFSLERASTSHRRAMPQSMLETSVSRNLSTPTPESRFPISKDTEEVTSSIVEDDSFDVRLVCSESHIEQTITASPEVTSTIAKAMLRIIGDHPDIIHFTLNSIT